MKLLINNFSKIKIFLFQFLKMISCMVSFMKLYLASLGKSNTVDDPFYVPPGPYSASFVVFNMLTYNYCAHVCRRHLLLCSSRIFSSQKLFPLFLRQSITWPHLPHLRGGTRCSWPLRGGGSDSNRTLSEGMIWILERNILSLLQIISGTNMNI